MVDVVAYLCTHLQKHDLKYYLIDKGPLLLRLEYHDLERLIVNYHTGSLNGASATA